MLAPHHREDAELGKIRVPAEYFFYAFVLVRLKPVLRDEFWSNGGIGCNSHAVRTLADVANGSTRETFSVGSRDKKKDEYRRLDRCLTS